MVQLKWICVRMSGAGEHVFVCGKHNCFLMNLQWAVTLIYELLPWTRWCSIMVQMLCVRRRYAQSMRAGATHACNSWRKSMGFGKLSYIGVMTEMMIDWIFGWWLKSPLSVHLLVHTTQFRTVISIHFWCQANLRRAAREEKTSESNQLLLFSWHADAVSGLDYKAVSQR